MRFATVRRRIAGLLVGPLLVTGVVAIGTVAAASPAHAAADPCVAPVNVIACENTKPGTPESDWDVSGQGDASIQGFATDISVNVGSTVSFKVKTPGAYTVDIYRLGYYQGNGARFIVRVPSTPRTQPACKTEDSTHLIDCGNWQVSASWAVPSTAVSGVYIAKLTRTDNGDDSHIPFVVRDDASTSAIVMQTSDTTWQAYNNYGGDQFYDNGANLYGGPSYVSNNRAYKVSYNRPFATRSWEGGRDYLFSNEYPMIRFLERNGYDISYLSGIDADRSAALLKQHKVLLTAGHDEYWSGNQRANVQAARDAGVNLAFFTGNDMYWKTRYEASTASTDGSSTTRRTLVSYKETWASAKIDPTSTWTGTWRDPRFSPPGDGNLPENALVGTAFMSNISDLPITVSAEEGKMRVWRGTSLASQSAGSSTALAAHTVGYESNEDLDNGFRPAGTIDMSTTTGPSAARLTDWGASVAAGTTTHHITQYKAASGALVFSAGSVQWAWGLDQEHDGSGAAADSRIQQATVNILADMGAPATTLMSGLTAAAKSTDISAPTSAITSPAANATIANGTKVTVTGTASDVGGVVGGVEVSADGGATWHPASGKASWTYSFIASGSGSVSIKSRATDDSGNIETPSAGRTVTMNCPCSLWGAAVPNTADAGDTSDVEVGVKFKPTTSGYIAGIRFYKSSANTGTHTGTLWSSGGTALATGTFTNETASGWQTLTFNTPVAVTSGTTYVASYRSPKGHYAADSDALSVRDWVAGPLTANRSVAGDGNGVYANGGLFPSSTYHDENYFVDVSFTTVNSSPPSITASSPRSGQVGVAANSVVTATFADAINTGSAQVAVKTAGGTAVAGSVTYDATSRTVTFTPTSAFAASTGYTVTVSGATSTSGVTMASTSWSFTTDSSASCPCSLFGTTSVPVTVDSADSDPLELGVRFTPGVDGFVSGVKFYKASANTGTHTGTLWSAGGTALATGTFANETASGWQTLAFSAPVAVTAGTTYTASYRAPNGHYSADSNFFATPFTSGQLSAPATNNGVYAYGTGGTAPTATFGATNYWVDPLFQTTASAPVVTSTSPASGATGVGVGATVSATFSGAMQSGTGTFTVASSSGAVAGAVTLATDGKTFVFTPNGALSAATTYTATITGAKNTFGVTMSGSTTWNFTTAGTAACPCSLFSSTSVPATPDVADNSSVELGVRFSPATAGFISGVKFYKSAANSGTHTGTLWSASGTALATGTFTNETSSGWQTLVFDSPVAVTAGTTYTASYLAPNGHYAGDSGYFTSAVSTPSLVAPANTNGVYIYGRGGTVPTSTYSATNYWVDVLFQTSSSPPSVVSTSPASGATGIPVGSAVSAVFSTTLESGSAVVTVTKSGGSAVAGATTLGSDNKTVVFTPSAALENSATYNVSVSGAKSTSGVSMTGSTTWSFTTVAAANCPCSLFTSSSTPATVDSGDTSSVELGVRIKPTVSGTITAVKFYKAAANTGTHTGTLWSSTGTVLATGTFTNETASGWQTLTFATPVSVTAGTVYTASYKAPAGHYSVNSGYFNSDYSTAALIAPAAARHQRGRGVGFGHHRHRHLDDRRGILLDRPVRDQCHVPDLDGHRREQRHLSLGLADRAERQHPVLLPGGLRRRRRQLDDVAGHHQLRGDLHDHRGCRHHPARDQRGGGLRLRDVGGGHLDHQRVVHLRGAVRDLGDLADVLDHGILRRDCPFRDVDRAHPGNPVLLPGDLGRCRGQLHHLTGHVLGGRHVHDAWRVEWQPGPGADRDGKLLPRGSTVGSGEGRGRYVHLHLHECRLDERQHADHQPHRVHPDRPRFVPVGQAGLALPADRHGQPGIWLPGRLHDRDIDQRHHVDDGADGDGSPAADRGAALRLHSSDRTVRADHRQFAAFESQRRQPVPDAVR